MANKFSIDEFHKSTKTEVPFRKSRLLKFTQKKCNKLNCQKIQYEKHYYK